MTLRHSSPLPKSIGKRPLTPPINQKLVNLHRICKINCIKFYMYNGYLYASDKRSGPEYDTYKDIRTNSIRYVNVCAMLLLKKSNFIYKSSQKLDFISKKYLKCDNIYIITEYGIQMTFKIRTPKNGNYVRLFFNKHNYKCVITKFYMFELLSTIKKFAKTMLIPYYTKIT